MDAEQVMTFRVVRASGAITEVDAVFSEGKWYARKGWPRVSADTPREAIVAYCHHNEIDVEEIRLPGQETGAEMGARMIGEAVAHVTATLTRERDAARSERDAALAAVDAVRADYAPRALPPTVAEAAALRARYGSALALCCLGRMAWVVEIDAGWWRAITQRVGAVPWCPVSPDGPVAWSQLARLVAQGGV